MVLVPGSIKVLDLPETKTFKSFEELLQAFEQYLAVEIPDSITNVVVSTQPPTSPSRNVIWYKLNASGSLVGQFVFSGGAYRQQFPPPNEVTKMHGSSDAVPAGYKLVIAGEDGFTTPEVLTMQATWYPPGPTGPWTIFDVIYTGL